MGCLIIFIGFGCVMMDLAAYQAWGLWVLLPIVVELIVVWLILDRVFQGY
jgi:hypothetical protein